MAKSQSRSRTSRRRTSPLFAAELTTRQPGPRSAEVKRASLAGGREPPIGRKPAVASAIDARVAVARRFARGARPDRIAGLLAALAHPQRVEILLKLLGGESTHQALAQATQLKAGPLYHHLRELRMASLIGPKVRDRYVLTPKGGRAILAVLAFERLCR